MPKIIWLLCALPVVAALLDAYFTIKKRPLRLAAKGCATSTAGGIIIAAVALFVLADVLLDLKFLWGVAAFALGHIALIFWLLEQQTALQLPLFTVLSFSAAAVLYAISAFFFRNPLRSIGKKAIALLLYAAVLALMTGISLTLPHFAGIRYLPFTLGACLFMVSDLFVAQGILVGMARKWHILGMILYESAVLLMAISA